MSGPAPPDPFPPRTPPSFVLAFLAPVFHGKQPMRAESPPRSPSPLKVTHLELRVPNTWDHTAPFHSVIASLRDSGPWALLPYTQSWMPALPVVSGAGAPGSLRSLTFPLLPPFTVTVTWLLVCDITVFTFSWGCRPPPSALGLPQGRSHIPGLSSWQACGRV